MSMNKSAKPPELKPLVKVLRIIRNIDGAVPTVTLELKFRNDDGELCTIRIPKSMVDALHKVRDLLRDAGAFLPAGQGAIEIIQKAFEPVFDPKCPLPIIDRTSRNGWHGRSFVLPGITFGPQKGRLEFERLVVHPPDDKAPEKKDAGKLVLSRSGTLQAWQSGHRRPCKISDEVTFAMATAFAAPLLPFSKLQEAAIFLFVGISGGAKTLSCLSALSVFRSVTGGQLSDFNQTDTALEELCAAHNHMLVVVDDTGTDGQSQAELERRLTKLAYTVTSGKGRQRSLKVQSQGLPNLTFRNLVLSSSEDSLQKIDPKQRRKIGEEVRLIEIPVYPPEKGGVFFRAGSYSSDVDKERKRLCESVGKVIGENFGIAIGPYIESLIENYDELPSIIDEITCDFMADADVGSASAANRIARKFALVCAGGRLAARYGVAPWDEKRCSTACRRLFKRTMLLYRRGAPIETTAKLIARGLYNQLVDYPKNFPRVEEGQTAPSIPDDILWGIRRTIKGIDCLLISKASLYHILSVKNIPAQALAELKATKTLSFAGEVSATRQVQVKGWPGPTDRPSFYCFDIRKLRHFAE